MESLNDIFGRQRHQQRPEQRPGHDGTSQQGQRPTHGSQGKSGHGPTTRRPLPEQTGHQGPPMPPHSSRGTYTGQQYNQQIPAKTRPDQGKYDPAFPNTRDQREGRAYGASHSRPPQNMQRSTAGGTYQSRPRALPEPQNARIRPVPTQQQERPTQSLSRYHYTDDYTPALPADVIEDWEEEDDATSIRYGDWEEEEQDEGEVVVYQRTDIDAIPQPRRPYTYSGNMTRDFSHPDDAEEQARITRNLRDLRMPVAMQPASAQSIPQALTREMQRYHRTTQPLNPQVVVEMNREHEQEMRQPVKPVRAVASREQGKQQELHYVSAAPATTPPMAPKSVCPRCKGAGYLRVDVPFGHPNFGKPTPCSCKDNEKKEKRRQQLREMSNLDAFYDKTFRTFNARVPGVQEAYQVSADYAQNPAGWLLLVGPNGCGKTHLAAAIANQGLEDGAVVLFAVVPDLLDHLRAAFAPTATEVYDQLFAKMREAELLVLDDLGSQQSSPWANEKLFQLLNYRYNMGMPTVITANPRGLQGIDERIRSRLSDVSLVIAVHLDRARDYRPNHPRRD